MKSRHHNTILCLLLILTFSVFAHAQEDANVSQIKAAFVLNFMKYAEWPPFALGENDGELVLVVIGDDPMKTAIQDVIDGNIVQQRKVRVLIYNDLADWKVGGAEGHAMFVSTSAWPTWNDLQAAISSRAVLTIGASPGFCAAGGVLNLFTTEEKIRFEANPSAARAAGVKLRADLLKLAVIVETTKERKP